MVSGESDWVGQQVWCQEKVTGWDSRYELQLVSQDDSASISADPSCLQGQSASKMQQLWIVKGNTFALLPPPVPLLPRRALTPTIISPEPKHYSSYESGQQYHPAELEKVNVF